MLIFYGIAAGVVAVGLYHHAKACAEVYLYRHGLKQSQTKKETTR